MPNFVSGHPWTPGEVVTDVKIKKTIEDATFVAGAVTTAALAAGAVTAAKIGAGAVTTAALSNSCVQTNNLNGRIVYGSNIVFETITEAEMADQSVSLRTLAPDALELGAVGIYHDKRAMNAAGGSFSLGWQGRALSHLAFDSHGLLSAPSGNHFTLPAGTWLIEASAPAYRVGNHQARIEVSTSAVVATGQTNFTSIGNNDQNNALVSGIVTIASPTAYRIAHRCATERLTDGFGVANGFTDEIYTVVKVTKLK